MAENKTHYESLAELRQAIVNLWYVMIYNMGRNLLSLGGTLVDIAIEADISDEPGLINDACDALENLSKRKPDITVEIHDEFSQELRLVVGKLAAYYPALDTANSHSPIDYGATSAGLMNDE